jgi:hypothetical protein
MNISSNEISAFSWKASPRSNGYAPRAIIALR